MSSLPMTVPEPGAVVDAALCAVPERRVRHQARESLAVMAMSVGLSGGLATLLLLLTSAGR